MTIGSSGRRMFASHTRCLMVTGINGGLCNRYFILLYSLEDVRFDVSGNSMMFFAYTTRDYVNQ